MNTCQRTRSARLLQQRPLSRPTRARAQPLSRPLRPAWLRVLFRPLSGWVQRSGVCLQRSHALQETEA
jgi:hypothetical protein